MSTHTSPGDRSQRVLLVSLGKLNGLLLQLLARRSDIAEIQVATRDPERAMPSVHLARLGAAAEGFFPKIHAVRFDLNDTASSAETLSSLRPDVTLAAPSLQSWWVLEELPARLSDPLRPAGFGAWLPFQLLPMIRFMKAWKESGLRSPVLSAPYPDVVNPILATQGLAPTAGVGNVGELVPKLRCLLADRLSVAAENVRVWLAAHHAFQPYVFAKKSGEPPPFLLHVEAEGRSVDSMDAESILLEEYRLPSNLDFQFLTVGTFVSAIRVFLGSANEIEPLHLPAPNGLPGGYPVVVRDGAVSLDLPPAWERDKAIEVNRASHLWDGIESIEKDGAIVYAPRTTGILREILGYDWPRMGFDDVDGAADELRRRFDDYVKGTR